MKYLITFCLIFIGCGGNSPETATPKILNGIGGVDVGNPGASAYQAEYRSPYGYSLHFSSELTPSHTNGKDFRLQSKAAASSLQISPIDRDGTKQTEAALTQLIGGDDIHLFDRTIGKRGEIIYKRKIEVGELVDETNFYLTPQGAILRVQLLSHTSDPLRDRLYAVLPSLDYDLTPPSIELVQLVANSISPAAVLELDIDAAGLLETEEPRATVAIKKIGEPNSSVIRVKPTVTRQSNRRFRLAISSELLPTSGDYIITRIGFSDQAGNFDHLWSPPNDNTGLYSEIAVPANEGFDESADKLKSTRMGVLAFHAEK
jgi:hypothetical protein